MEIIKITHLKHSGIGKNAHHIKVCDEFKKGISEGIKYCLEKNWEATIEDGILTIRGKGFYAFEMKAMVKNN